MATLTAAYFVGEITIPNISGSSITETANLFGLQVLIAKYEPIYLKWLLGEDFYTDYVAGLAESSPEARWTTLRDKIFVVDSVLEIGTSPAANYVYCQWLKTNNSITSTNGEFKPSAENMTSFTMREKYVTAYNEMVRMSLEIQDWLLYDVLEDYPELDTDSLGVFETINSWGI